MAVKASPQKIRRQLVATPILFLIFFSCIFIFLAWLSYQMAFVSSQNNYAGYILFFGILAGLFWYLKIFGEHYRIFKILSHSTIEFGLSSFKFTNPSGMFEIPFDQIKRIEFHDSYGKRHQRSFMIQIFINDPQKIEMPNDFLKVLPKKIVFHEKPFLILRDVYEQSLFDVISAIPVLKSKMKHYNDFAWSRVAN